MSMLLSRPFASAGLRLELPARPLRVFSPEIFQMDIFRFRGPEMFRLWKGHESNAVRVTDTDQDRRQLVILVQEPSRAFDVPVFKAGRTEPPDEFRGLELFRETPTQWIFRRRTPSTMRRFLCGMDESHLFIAQFEGGTTVKDAHRKLKPEAVVEADRSAPGRTLRQGEWFFVKLPAFEHRMIGEQIRKSPHFVERPGSLGGNGRPHTADEVLRRIGPKVYARGKVRHPDHKTLVLDEWRQIHRNAEVRASQIGANGVYWVD
ncbi:MAG TPA: hypothetical protein VE981_18480 [Planctomycetota bacterium]|nr:hypothetical protein [Planctomycetota bacterium]